MLVLQNAYNGKTTKPMLDMINTRYNTKGPVCRVQLTVAVWSQIAMN